MANEKLAELVATLTAAEDQKKFNKIEGFRPYAKQSLFFELGKTMRERLFMAGNQLGKCLGYQTLIDHPDGTSTPAGELFERGEAFQVMAWDGEKKVAAWATAAIRKPAEPLVRLWLASGDHFECALDHRVLVQGRWAFVREVLPFLPASIPACTRPALRSSARHWWGRASSWLGHCFAGRRPYDEPLLAAQGSGLFPPPSRGGARPHSPAPSRTGAASPRHTSTPQPAFDRPSSLGGRFLRAALAAAWRAQASYKIARHRTGIPRVAEQLHAASVSLLQSAVAAVWGHKTYAYASPIDGNRYIGYEMLPCQAVYDFTVPAFHNYFAAGVVHHNTEAGAVETAYHLTGRYPKGWKGRRFTKPVKAWACCKTAQLVRDGAQEKLCGAPGVEAAFGTGYIPKADFVDRPSLGRGISDGYDTIQVQHYHNGVKDGTSILRFKTYDQGRQKFQGDTLDFIWLDEECPIDIYSECLARITATNGFLYMTFTPLLGKSAVVIRFMEEESPDRVFLQMRIDEVGHLTPERIAQIMSAYAPHEREARLNGVPKLGDGAIFPYPDELITEPRIRYIPDFWFKIWGMDFGIEHPFAAVLIAIDRDADCYHVLHTVRIKDQLPIQHAAAMKRIAGNAPVAWPHDGENREKGTGEPLAAMYKKEGLKMLPSHATWPTGGYATEPGVNMMQGLMTQGKFKVAADLSDWLEEKRNYHRKDGKIVKAHDDLMSATRIAIMQQRSAQPIILGPPPAKTKGGNNLRADGADDEGSYFGY